MARFDETKAAGEEMLAQLRAANDKADQLIAMIEGWQAEGEGATPEQLAELKAIFVAARTEAEEQIAQDEEALD